MALRHSLLENTSRFLTHTTEILGQNISDLDGRHVASPTASSVLFLISEPSSFSKHPKTPWLVLNKRSEQVRQPGDLCFPGGGPSPRVDTMLAKSLSLPGFPFSRWRSRVGYPFSKNGHLLAQLLATCLRESFEEMRLIPLAVKFLGPLPSQRLVMFDRVIYPMVGWVKYQKYFWLNGEVASLVHIPIEQLFNPDNYAYFQITYPSELSVDMDQKRRQLPCYVHQPDGTREILWGATYRMIMTFLWQVFDFVPPETSTLPRIDSPLSPAYFNRN